MLIELRIRNLAVIDSVTLTLDRGLNVLTGETGAGKSIIVGALSFLLGERAASDRVRSGSDRASVDGVFEPGNDSSLRSLLDERGIDTDDAHVVLKREVSANGRSRAWVNASPVTAGVLADIGNRLVSIHGQHESRQLLDAEAQRELLDRYAGATDTAKAVRQAFRTLQELQQRERELEQSRRESAARADYLRFVVREIEDAKLKAGEDEAVDQEIRRLSHAEELQSSASEAVAALGGTERSVQAMLRSVRRVLVAIERIDPEAGRWLTSLDEVSVTLEELSRDIEAFSESVEADPVRLRSLESRRDQLLTALRKYGPTIDDALVALADSKSQLARVDDEANASQDIAAERAEAERALSQSARELSALRAKAANRLASEVSALLPELGMVDGVFNVTLLPTESTASYGNESVHFSAALNAGGETRPLDRIASGGELSRLMLALSTVLSRLQHVPTLVFDEIDAGIGGTVAWQVGALMQRVAEHHQVLAISHLAQIAAHADHHVAVRKGAVGAVTTADTTVLTDDARMIEIARMLGGDEDREVSRAHARELIERGTLAKASQRNRTIVEGAPRATRTQRRGKPV